MVPLMVQQLHVLLPLMDVLLLVVVVQQKRLWDLVLHVVTPVLQLVLQDIIQQPTVSVQCAVTYLLQML
jgi:hypothetical protein